MALTRATDKIIANADGNLNLSGIVTASSFSGPLVPSGDLNVGNNIKLGTASGIITATSFSGDGSNLTSLPAGLGTALSSTQTSPLNKLYYTNEILSIGATVTVDHPSTGTGAYTQYADLRLEEGADLIIEDGDDVIPDILGLGTDGGGLGAGGTGRIRVDSITNKNANGAPTFPNGAVVTGIITATNVSAASSVTATTFYGSGANLTGISVDTTKIETGNTKVETVDTGSDGHVKITTEGSERLRIASNGQVSISSDGTTDGLLTIKGDTDQVSTPSIRLLDGSDTREVSITNTSGDFVASVHGNDNAIHGHIKMFESGIFDINNGGASGSNVNRLRVDVNGNVTKPNNFHILVDMSQNYTVQNASTVNTNLVKWDRVVTSQSSTGASSYFNTSTHLLTAPVSGLYYFDVAVNCDFNVEGAWLVINGSRANYSVFKPNSANTSTGNVTYKLSANDTVGLKWYDNGNTNADFFSNALHTWWRIILLG